MKKKFLALIMATTMIASLVGCGAKDDKTTTENNNSNTNVEATTAPEATATPAEAEAVTLKVWAPENQIQNGTMDSMTASFQALHPEWDITFTVEAQGEDTAKDEILKDVTAAGDVFFFANDQLNELVKAGAIARLGGSTEEMVKTTMADAVVKTVTVDDAI